MKFGRRRQEADATGPPDAADSVASHAPPHESVADSWTVPGGEQPAAPVPEPEPASPAPVAYEEAVVEGEAVELPASEPPAAEFHRPVPLTIEHPALAPEATPFAVADERVAAGVVAAAPVSSLADGAGAFASRHAAAPGPSWQEPVMELANERPELVVAAAFAGGLLTAMILRRLAH